MVNVYQIWSSCFKGSQFGLDLRLVRPKSGLVRPVLVDSALRLAMFRGGIMGRCGGQAIAAAVVASTG